MARKISMSAEEHRRLAATGGVLYKQWKKLSGKEKTAFFRANKIAMRAYSRQLQSN